MTTKNTKPTHTPGLVVGKHAWSNGDAANCLKCGTLCAVSIIPNRELGWCEMCLRPVRAAAPDLLSALKELAAAEREYDAVLADEGPKGVTLDRANIRRDHAYINADAAIAKAEGR